VDIDQTDRTVRRWLGHWVDEGLLQKMGDRKSTRYLFIAPKKQNLGFLHDLDEDLRTGLISRIRNLWTHTSTAIEGNTLSLGDTREILEAGLTISGKSLREHREVVGHAQAIDIIYDMLDSPLRKDNLFLLHQAVQTEIVMDVFKPNGAWKVEPNGTFIELESGKSHWMEYAAPAEVDGLMQEFIRAMNAVDIHKITSANVAETYARFHMGLAHIHPFWDGNGRMARLIANIPLLKAGWPPLLILVERRKEYIEMLGNYQFSVGQLECKTGVWPQPAKLKEFASFCQQCYQDMLQLVEHMRGVQAKRKRIF
jgi:Fic family protein